MPNRSGWEGISDRIRGCVRFMSQDTLIRQSALVVRFLLRDPNLPAAMQSISVRVVLAMLFEITRMPPARFSPDPCLHSQVINKLHEIAIEIASGTSSTLSKSLPLVIMTISRGCIIVNIKIESSKQPRIDSLCRDPSDSSICYFILAYRLS